jgi:hypothetical protein
MAKDDGSGGNVKWVIGAVLVPILVACIGAGVFQVKVGCLPFTCGNSGTGGGDQDGGGGGFDPSQPASIFLSRTSGPGGSTVNVSGEGFKPGEEVVISFHTEEIGRTDANGEGRFANVAVTIPTTFSQFAPQKFDIVANGRTSIKSARAQFTLSG